MAEENQELVPKPRPVLVQATRVDCEALSEEEYLSRADQHQPLLDDLDTLLIFLLAVCVLLLVCLAYYVAVTETNK